MVECYGISPNSMSLADRSGRSMMCVGTAYMKGVPQNLQGLEACEGVVALPYRGDMN
jgi:hypothetical protein